MDTITQMALGATIAEAGFRKHLGWRSLLFGAACGLLPDLDMVTRIAGEWASMVHHRGMSHSFPVLALLTPLVGWLGFRFFRGSPQRGGEENRGSKDTRPEIAETALLGSQGETNGSYFQWTHLAFWALLTHPALDAFTSYGTQLLAPFSRRRFAFDGVSIIDLVYTLPLFAVLVWAFLTRRRPQSSRQRWVATGVLVFTTAYLLFGTWMSYGIAKRARAQLAGQGFHVAHVRATPTFFWTGLFRVVARDGDGHLRVGYASGWFPRRIRFHKFTRPQDPLVKDALASPRGKIFQWFADGYVDARMVTHKGHRVVVLRDMRLGFVSNVDRVVFTARFTFDGRGRLASARTATGSADLKIGEELSAFWYRFIGGG